MAKEEKKKAKKFEPNKRQAALNERQQTKIRYLKKTEQDDRVRALTRAFTQKNKEAEIMSDRQKARVEYLKKQGREDDALKVRNKARVAAGLKKVKPKPKPVTDSSGRVQTGRDRADASNVIADEVKGYQGNGDPRTIAELQAAGIRIGGRDPENWKKAKTIAELQAEGKYIGTYK